MLGRCSAGGQLAPAKPDGVRFVCLQRQSGGVAGGPHGQFPAAVHPQQQYYPSQPLYVQDVPLQEVPNGHDVCPTGKKSSLTPDIALSSV